MAILIVYFVLTQFLILSLEPNVNGISDTEFPKDFLFGIATSSYQTEGAWNLNGKVANIWDHFTHISPEKIKDSSNGDIACDSYHNIEEDVALIKNLGVDYYRFSLAWSRIIPHPFSKKINEDGIRYYNQLIDLLLKNNVQPMVTLFHWDIPQYLQDLGGFENSHIVDEFVSFSRIAFEYFGDRVKWWTTFNEPQYFCWQGYGHDTIAPGVNSSGIGDYLCTHNILKAHAKTYHMYNNTFKHNQKGRISITLASPWYKPASDDNNDILAADRALQFELGYYAHPIFSSRGNYPDIMIKTINKRSSAEGFSKSRLPEFTQEEIEEIRGSYDFFSLNHYTTYLVADKQPEPIGEPSYVKDKNVKLFHDPTWPETVMGHNKVVPWGFTNILKWIKREYGDPEIYIAENGYGDLGEINDIKRVDYFSLYLKSLLDAIYKHGVRVKGYTAWSLLDNYEWDSGYTAKFGLYQVNFENSNRTRTAKTSAAYYKQLISNRRLTEDTN